MIWYLKTWEVRSNLCDSGQVGVPHLITESREAKWNHQVTLTGLVCISGFSWFLPKQEWWNDGRPILMCDVSLLGFLASTSWHTTRKHHSKIQLSCSFHPELWCISIKLYYFKIFQHTRYSAQAWKECFLMHVIAEPSLRSACHLQLLACPGVVWTGVPANHGWMI